MDFSSSCDQPPVVTKPDAAHVCVTDTAAEKRHQTLQRPTAAGHTAPNLLDFMASILDAAHFEINRIP